MPTNEPFIQEVQLDAEEALRRMRELGDEEGNLAQSSRQAGDAAEQQSRQQDRATSVVTRTKNAVAGMVQSWVSFIAIGGRIIQLIRSISGELRETVKAVADLGSQLRGLAANIGGANADAVVRQINNIARRQSLGVQQRDALIASATTLTDLDPGLERGQLLRRINQLGNLAAATDRAGPEVATLFTTFQNQTGLNDRRTADALSKLFNSGFEVSALQQIVNKGGGDVAPLTGLLLGSRRFVDQNRAGRTLLTVVDAVSRLDEEGNLDKDLTRLGLTSDQSPVQRLAALARGVESGDVSQRDLQAALGSAAAVRQFEPFRRTIVSGGLDQALAELSDASVFGEIERVRRSKLVRAEERQRSRELRIQIAKEGGIGSEAGDVTPFEAFDEVQAVAAEDSFGSQTLGTLRVFGDALTGNQAGFNRRVFEAASNLAGLEGNDGGGGTVINNNIGLQVNTPEDPLVSDSGRRGE